jgi:hypothetical protein
MGESSARKSVVESLRAQALDLRKKNEGIQEHEEAVREEYSILHADAHLEMLGVLDKDRNESGSPNTGDEELVPAANRDAIDETTTPDVSPTKISATRSVSSWFGADEPEPTSAQSMAASAADNHDARRDQQQQTAMISELLAMIVSMNNRMRKQDAELAKVRRVVEQGARQGWSASAGARRK